MPKSDWIQEAELVPERKPYKIDTSGRVAIPAHIRAKFDVTFGDDMDYYTSFAEDKWFLCMTKHIPTEEELAKKAE